MTQCFKKDKPDKDLNLSDMPPIKYDNETSSSKKDQTAYSTTEQLSINRQSTSDSKNAIPEGQSGSSPGQNSKSEEEIRKRVKFFFMNPLQKYKQKEKRCVLVLQGLAQGIKIVAVVIQVIVFGYYNQTLSTFKWQNGMGFRSEFMLRDDPTFYTKSDVYSQVNLARQQYASWKNNTVGVFRYPSEEDNSISSNEAPPIVMCVCNYDNLEEPSPFANLTFDFKKQTKICYSLQRWEKDTTTNPITDHVPLINGTEYKFEFPRLISIKLAFEFMIVQIKMPLDLTPPICYNTAVSITIDFSPYHGAMTSSLESKYHMITCTGEKDKRMDWKDGLLIGFDVLIVILSSLSTVSCTWLFCQAKALCRDVVDFLGKENVSRRDKLKFFDIWLVVIIISDCLIIIGTIFKSILQNQNTKIIDYKACSILLGVGCLFLFVGFLRYLGFFKKFNILIRTLRKAIPDIGRFMLCTLLLYAGFLICGWITLGPFHRKFSTINLASQTLFSLVNGDDMYATFDAMSEKNSGSLTFIIEHIYLYVFVALFVWAVLNLFITLITNAYETIRETREEPKKTEFEKFINSCTEDAKIGDQEALLGNQPG